MDISNIVNTELLFKLELRHPATDENLGITFQIRSAGSREAKAIQRRQSDSNMERMQKRKTLKGAELERQMLERAASYIAGWDWGDQTWKGETPEYSTETAITILGEADWIFAQVTEAAEDIANFSKDSGPISPKPSE